MLKVHQKVTIYQDPITQKVPEGEAVLLHKVRNLSDGQELWKVCFKGDDGEVYERIIQTN